MQSLSLSNLIKTTLKEQVASVGILPFTDNINLKIIPKSFNTKIRRSTGDYEAFVTKIYWSFSLLFENEVFYKIPIKEVSTSVDLDFDVSNVSELILARSKQYILQRPIVIRGYKNPQSLKVLELMKSLVSFYHKDVNYSSPAVFEQFIRAVTSSLHHVLEANQTVDPSIVEFLQDLPVKTYEDTDCYVFSNYKDESPFVLKKTEKGLIKVGRSHKLSARPKLVTQLTGHS